MSFLFGSKEKTAKEVAREQQNQLRKNERSMEREQRELQQQEQKLIVEIKKASKAGNMVAANTLAKQLVRTREALARTSAVKGQLQGVSSQVRLAATQNTLVTSMAGAAKAVGMSNKQVDVGAMQKVIGEFTKENDIMSNKQEFMDDAFDDIFDEDGLGDEADAVTAQVLEEIGLEYRGKMAAVPQSAVAASQAAAAARAEAAAAEEPQEDDDEALMRRLQALR